MNLLQTLPDDCTLEEIQYQLYVVAKLKNSDASIKAEGTLSHHHVEQRLLAASEMMTLSTNDWNIFIKSLDETETMPRPKLSAAMKRYKDWQKA